MKGIAICKQDIYFIDILEENVDGFFVTGKSSTVTVRISHFILKALMNTIFILGAHTPTNNVCVVDNAVEPSFIKR